MVRRSGTLHAGQMRLSQQTIVNKEGIFKQENREIER